MKIVKEKDYDAMSQKAAEMMIRVMKGKTQPILGLATGSTPIKLYENLISAYKQGEISFRNVCTYNLDEYIGLSKTNKNSYHYFMKEKLFDHIDIPVEQTYIPNGVATDPEVECTDFEAAIAKAGIIDLQILGVGMNGHIGFNEPGTPFDARTHVIELEQETREVNSRFFEEGEDVPTHAITMGIGTILEAKEIVLLVSGKKKADILREIVHGEVTEEVPASILQRHPNVTVITDIDF